MSSRTFRRKAVFAFLTAILLTGAAAGSASAMDQNLLSDLQNHVALSAASAHDVDVDESGIAWVSNL